MCNDRDTVLSSDLYEHRPDNALAQHFTPACVARRIWLLVRKRGGRALAAQPRVIDLAAGAGTWLDAALESGHVRGEDVHGIEIDPRWQLRSGISHTGDGLLGDFPGVEDESFDAVIGNPPFGKLAAFRTAMGDPSAEALATRFELWSVIGNGASSFPIEWLFVERALQVVRPGGWVALILPEGLLANARWQGARDWLLERARLCDVVGLPAAVFRCAGLNARAAFVVLQKGVASAGRRVRLVEVKESKGAVDVEAYLHQVWAGRGSLLCSTGVFQRQLVGRRWDRGYWRGAVHVRQLARRFGLRRLGDFIEHLTYGPIITGRKPEHVEGGIPVIRQGDIAETGLEESALLRVEECGDFDPQRSRVQRGDLLLPRSGAGALGRNRTAVYAGRAQANIGCFVDLVRLRGINPYYAWFFFKTPTGWEQIAALINGVGTPNINFGEIRSLSVVEAPEQVQQAVEWRYRREVLPWHRKRLHSAQARQEGERRFSAIVGDLQRFLSGGMREPFLVERAGAA